MDMTYLENINILWSHLICKELHRWGIAHAFVSPGYRNVPMMFALDAMTEMTRHVCIDERSAAYRALGYVKSSGKPALLVCTSGTAGANYLPAIIEAAKEQLPLVVVTTDRPFEMIHAGANQVIEQQGLYGRFARLSLALPAASVEYAPRVVLAHVAHLMAQAMMDPCAPVHLNVPFREPLEPLHATAPAHMTTYIAEALGELDKRIASSTLQPCVTRFTAMTADATSQLSARLASFKRPLFILGRLGSARDTAKIERFSHDLGWPVYCDIASSLRGHAPDREIIDAGFAAMMAILEEYRPDGILHLGRRLVSKHFDAYIAKQRDLSYHVVNPVLDIQDVTFHPDAHVTMDEGAFVDQIELQAAQTRDETAIRQLLAGSHDFCSRLDAAKPTSSLSLPMLATLVADQIEKGSLLFLGNSASIRAFDRFLLPQAAKTSAMRSTHVEANRGASGIEGLLSTAIGLAHGAPERPVTAVIGDISLLHDLSALATMGIDRGQPFIVIIVNDHGGGIFRTLPAANFPHIAPYLQTPHELEFGAVARMAGVPYARTTTRTEFIGAYGAMAKERSCGVIECIVAADDNRHDENKLLRMT